MKKWESTIILFWSATRMSKKWFQQKEQAAGSNRLILTWWIYKYFGEAPIRLIANAMAFFTYIFAKEQRNAIKKYLNILSDYKKDTSLKYSFFKGFQIFKNYANSLADKMIAFSGNFKETNIQFFNEDDGSRKVIENVESGKGMFFITTHIGNAELIRTLLFSSKYKKKPRVNVFMETKHCEIFNNFINHIALQTNLDLFGVEDIDINTSIITKERLDNGELVFMAGDRVSSQNTERVYQTKFLNHEIELPVGTLKFAQIMEVPVFFITCVKNNNKYEIHTQEFVSDYSSKKERLADLKEKYCKFLEEFTLKYPYQFYNFFDIFKD